MEFSRIHCGWSTLTTIVFVLVFCFSQISIRLFFNDYYAIKKMCKSRFWVCARLLFECVFAGPKSLDKSFWIWNCIKITVICSFYSVPLNFHRLFSPMFSKRRCVIHCVSRPNHQTFYFSIDRHLITLDSGTRI